MTRPVVSDDDSDDCSDEEDDDDIESRGLSAASIVGTKGLNVTGPPFPLSLFSSRKFFGELAGKYF